MDQKQIPRKETRKEKILKMNRIFLNQNVFS